ncbi:hypothetical protein PVK06_040608 [Gossypium arboreum]|uniref:Uncharacterized protein n=1 Tax=Gossypium arboreum TaxID=29729 RepID=A0ABR0N8R6_GOSAR|nr:hypothetical protein PVK06_040608 [Gossypium arboreum]
MHSLEEPEGSNLSTPRREEKGRCLRPEYLRTGHLPQGFEACRREEWVKGDLLDVHNSCYLGSTTIFGSGKGFVSYLL